MPISEITVDICLYFNSGKSLYFLYILKRRISWNKIKRNKLEPGTGWNELEPSGMSWNQLKPTGTGWNQVKVALQRMSAVSCSGSFKAKRSYMIFSKKVLYLLILFKYKGIGLILTISKLTSTLRLVLDEL